MQIVIIQYVLKTSIWYVVFMNSTYSQQMFKKIFLNLYTKGWGQKLRKGAIMLTWDFSGPCGEIIYLLPPFTDRSELRVNYKAVPLEVENVQVHLSEGQIIDFLPIYLP